MLNRVIKFKKNDKQYAIKEIALWDYNNNCYRIDSYILCSRSKRSGKEYLRCIKGNFPTIKACKDYIK